MLKKFGLPSGDACADTPSRARGAAVPEPEFRSAALSAPTTREAERADRRARLAMQRLLPSWASDVLELRRRGVLEATWDGWTAEGDSRQAA